MTYEKAAQALVDVGILDQDQLKAAVLALQETNVEITYPAWADALAKAGLIAGKDTAKAVEVMEKAGWAEADDRHCFVACQVDLCLGSAQYARTRSPGRYAGVQEHRRISRQRDLSRLAGFAL